MELRKINLEKGEYAISSIVNHYKSLPPVALLESTLYHKVIGRYSIAGAFPFMVVEGIPDGCTITRYNADGERGRTRELKGDPFLLLQQQYARYNSITRSEVPPWGGAIGFFSYELLYYSSLIGLNAPHSRKGYESPLYWFAFYDMVCIEDKSSGKMSLLASDLGCKAKNSSAYIQRKANLFKRHLIPAPSPRFPKALPAFSGTGVSEIRKRDYCNHIRTILKHIRKGDIFQACFTFTKTMPYFGASNTLYGLLRQSNPSPFSAFIATGNLEIVCCSPERFLKVSPDGTLEARPIKGTRPRGSTPEKDAALRAQLRASLKDQAENIMITDLLRNDMGRVCTLGSIKVKKLFQIEKYANVHQMVSIIEGKGKFPGRNNSIAYVKSLFPGGSMTGAPKNRALEILGSLESEKRGIYSGAIGYLGFNNSMDFNIAIRTAVVKNGTAFVGTGGGIVADSNPEAEYNEAQIKVQNILSAIGFVNQMSQQNE